MIVALVPNVMYVCVYMRAIRSVSVFVCMSVADTGKPKLTSLIYNQSQLLV